MSEIKNEVIETNVNLYDVKNAPLKYRDEFSTNPLVILLDVFLFYFLIYITVLWDKKTDEKYTLQIFSVGLILFVIYSVFIIYKNMDYVDKKKYDKLVSNLDNSIDEKIKSNYNKEVDEIINDKVGYRERKLKFIEECSKPINKQKDVLIGILATVSGTIFLATLKIIVENWNKVDISSGITYLSGVYLVVLIILLSTHLVLSLSNLKLRILYKRALSQIKLNTI